MSRQTQKRSKMIRHSKHVEVPGTPEKSLDEKFSNCKVGMYVVTENKDYKVLNVDPVKPGSVEKIYIDYKGKRTALFYFEGCRCLRYIASGGGMEMLDGSINFDIVEGSTMPVRRQSRVLESKKTKIVESLGPVYAVIDNMGVRWGVNEGFAQKHTSRPGFVIENDGESATVFVREDHKTLVDDEDVIIDRFIGATFDHEDLSTV